jgi:hypothetical protein
MIGRQRSNAAVRLACLAWVSTAGIAFAQPAQRPDGIAVGDFWFRPRVEVRLRAEYDHHPVTTSGDVPVLGTELDLPFELQHQWVVHERARVGLGVERGPLTAAVVVQDGHVAGFPSAVGTTGIAGTPTTSFHVAYIEAHSPELYPSFLRVGRQEVVLGEGRLVGVSDWLLFPRSLDSARARWVSRRFEVEVLAALLAPAASLPPEQSAQAPPSSRMDGATGAQMYVLDASLHLDPLFHAEILGLGRIARTPLPASLTPSDTLLVDARLFGDRAGLGYSIEMAYEVGRLAVVGGNRPIRAWATAGHLDWQTSWLLRPKVALSGSYASGGNGMPWEETHRFDPILPDARAGLGQMGIYAWTNVLDAAVTGSLAPLENVTLALGLRHVRLADPHDAWFAASLLPVGQNPRNESSFLGHEIDASVSYAPFEALIVSAGYGAFITGQGARAVLSGRSDVGPRVLSAAFAQASVIAP